MKTLEEQIIEYFNNNKPKNNSFKLNKCTFVNNAQSLIDISIQRLKLKNNKPYIDRLREIKAYIESEKINNIINNG